MYCILYNIDVKKLKKVKRVKRVIMKNINANGVGVEGERQARRRGRMEGGWGLGI